MKRKCGFVDGNSDNILKSTLFKSAGYPFAFYVFYRFPQSGNVLGI
jgi:hypothetical protein